MFVKPSDARAVEDITPFLLYRLVRVIDAELYQEGHVLWGYVAAQAGLHECLVVTSFG